MSLNGLDDPKVQGAHEAAVAEPGGWFLLKYASRDEVELLGCGSGGVTEVRNNVAQYEETSPLYGFLRYRRRNVLIKYLPEDCSRLIQARVAVHFNAVCERFSPYDTTFEIADSKELKDTKLSAACSLHAASGSNSSSSSSLRRRRLVEIAEEEEEEQQQRATKRQSLSAEDQDAEDKPEAGSEPVSPTEAVTLNSELATSPEERNFTAASTSEVPTFVGADDMPVSPSQSIDAARRMSSQSSRPDLFAYSSYTYGKPKVKLGPRPSLESGGRPRTAGAFRPVSQIPSGFKLFGKGSKRNKSRDETANADDILVETEDALSTSEGVQIVHTEITRPATSSGVSALNSPMMPPPPPTKPVISPEKARLMKAMKLREKKKNLAIKAAGAASPPIESPGPSEEESFEEKLEGNQVEVENNNTEAGSDGPSISNADSGISLDPSTFINTDQASDLTQTDSHPDSPVIASSEPEISTKASSLSESTDETLHPKREDVPEEDQEAKLEETTAGEDALKEPVAGDKTAIDAPPTDDGKIQGATPPPVSEPDTSIPAQQALSLDTSAQIGKTETDQIPDALETKNTEDASSINKDDKPLSPTSPALKIPTSKFSTHDLRSQNSAPAPAAEAPRQSTRESSPAIVAEDAVEEDAAEHKLPEPRQPKRKAHIEPIRTNFSTHSRPTSRTDHLSDDESLMDELQSATLEEAKPMLVAKSPVTPVFPSPTKRDQSPHIVRTVSNPVRGNFLAPGDNNQSSARSASSGAAYLNKVAQQQASSNLAKKSNVGSSISQRIKALEKLSASTGEAPVVVPSRDRPSSAFFSVGKSREPSRSPSVVDRATPFGRQSLRTPPSRSGSRDESPERVTRRTRRDRSNSVASRLSMFEAAVPESNSTGSKGPESISVTAKIVRDPGQNASKSFEPPKDPTEYNPLELKESPLLVDHQMSAPVWTPAALGNPKETIQERRMSKEGRRSESRNRSKDDKSRRSSLSVVKDFINDRRKSLTSPSRDVLPAPASSRSPTRPPSTHQSKRLSISSRRSSISRDKENVLSPSATTESSASGDETKSNSDKMKTRAGRFMRRLSSLSSSRGKTATPTLLSPTVQEEVPEPVRPVTTGSPSIVSYMGDVNVQFPDNLLWKRRNMCLDSQGFLILSALPAQSSRAAQGTKRYHLSEFRTPCIPDVEIQELPNSVVLDFVEGSGVQVACEDRAGQTKVLNILRDAHASHATAFGQ
ncbi:hypothetical protein FZEAL_2343 [Fusarium zealandicum]|uniref:ADF-H domain-containing protein n=1 Tax=Fusarium zealandicum TaxID=1053134 RepID=A0A8H4XNJ1_9HYPO|nr:hypothetical protein FZEAL_2343 [Fusarium zealandicum]